MTIDDVLAAQREGAVVLDTARAGRRLRAGHLRGAINVGLQGRFAEYVGDVLGADEPIVLVADPAPGSKRRYGSRASASTRSPACSTSALSAFLARPDQVVRSSRLTAHELADRVARVDALQVLDVRNPAELAAGAMTGARSAPLPRLNAELEQLDPTLPHGRVLREWLPVGHRRERARRAGLRRRE